MSQLPPAPLHPTSVTELVRVAFDNIQKNHYYYVHLCDSDDNDYQLLVRVTSYNSDEDDGTVRFQILQRRRIHLNTSGTGFGDWIEYDDDYGVSRNSVNSDEQEDCARFYLPA